MFDDGDADDFAGDVAAVVMRWHTEVDLWRSLLIEVMCLIDDYMSENIKK